jgi:hypothetical protein
MNSTKAKGEREREREFLVNMSMVVEVEEFMLQQYPQLI